MRHATGNFPCRLLVNAAAFLTPHAINHAAHHEISQFLG
jgi:hypothetical protein